MAREERIFISVILLFMAFMTILDLFNDFGEGVSVWHLTLEALMTFVSLFGAYILLKGVFVLKSSLLKERAFSAKLLKESTQWKENSKKYIEGLSHSIDEQLDHWGLTKSEKEIAFLLIKGFSLKEIAEFRQTTEKTTRGQATSIYAKSGLTGRSQLSAFFLEDLLVPNNE